MNNVRKINKQFYKYWKKESLEWRPSLFNTRRKFTILKRMSEHLNKSIYELVLKLLESQSIYEIDKSIVSDILGIDISDEEYKALLMTSGYYYHKPSRSYRINEERKKRVMNVCDATELFVREEGSFGVSEKINEIRMDFYQKKRDNYERRFQNIVLKTKMNTMHIEPANGERGQFISQILGKIVIMMIIGVLVLLVLYVNSLLFNKEAMADEPKLTFWNSLLGACIPGVITIMTTYFLIKHEYKVDYHKERMSVLPVFSFIHICDKNKYIDEKGKWNADSYPLEMLENTAQNDMISDEDVDLYILRNKGNGMAFNVSHDRGDEVFIFGDISQNEDKIIAIKKYSNLYYTISYMDLYGNKYTQRFKMDKSADRYNITTFPPELTFRTKLMRYQQ